MENLKRKKLFLMDLDGTLYLEDKLFDATPGFLSHIKSIGGKYFFMTNNSSKSVNDYVKKFDKIGVDAVAEDRLTSTQATVFYLKEHYGDKLVLIVKRERTDTRFSVGINAGKRNSLYNTRARCHNEIILIVKLLD